MMLKFIKCRVGKRLEKEADFFFYKTMMQICAQRIF